MKTILTLVVTLVSFTAIKAQNNSYHFMSNQQQAVKYDSVNKVYFVAQEINNTSKISIENNIISFVMADHKSYGVFVNNINLDSLSNKASFNLYGRDTRSGKNVKLGFWFIDNVLEEITYANEAIDNVIAYKDISDMSASTLDQKAVVSIIQATK
ncbi:MAG TPA: hypothetical protein VFV68_00385 [Agriterribacter sp.]|nr:hypothetical protein [Agriterribacter sp.]